MLHKSPLDAECPRSTLQLPLVIDKYSDHPSTPFLHKLPPAIRRLTESYLPPCRVEIHTVDGMFARCVEQDAGE